ncbi:MAG: hypothetical protein KDM91_15635 [Verrucomicrobiae bacterium]|nr:hypothetical protein [Verrucomicrobiae bacterium]
MPINMGLLLQTVGPVASFWSIPDVTAGSVHEFLVDYGPSIGMALVVFALGFFWGRLVYAGRKSGRPAGAGEAPSEIGAGEAEPAAADAADAADAVDPGGRARMEGELAEIRSLAAHQSGELRTLEERALGLRQQVEDRQRRVTELSAMLERAAAPAPGQIDLAPTRAPFIQLGEVIRQERQRVGHGVAHLTHLEERLDAEQKLLWDCAEEISQIKAQCENLGRRNGEKSGGPQAVTIPEKTAALLGQIDDQIRVFCQNMRGCLQRTAGARKRLQREQNQLRECSQSVHEIETSLAAFAEDSGEIESGALERFQAEATEKLAAARSGLDTLENGIDSEIAEIAGRTDWLVKDSPANLIKAIDRLGADQASQDLGLAMLIGRAWRRLGEVKGALAGLRLALETGMVSAPGEGGGKRALRSAAEKAAATLAAVTTLTPPDPGPEAVSPLAGLADLESLLTRRDADLRQLRQELEKGAAEIAGLRESLDARQAEAEEARAEADRCREALETERAERHRQPASKNLVRRLLGLGPSRRELAKPALEPVASFGEAQLLLAELRQASGAKSHPTTTTNGSAKDGGSNPTAPPARETVAGDAGDVMLSPSDELPDERPDPSSAIVLRELTGRCEWQQARIAELEDQLAGRSAIGLSTPPAEADERAESLPAPGEPENVILGAEFPDDAGEPLVLFRSDDPVHWDTDTSGPGECFSLPLTDLPERIDYLMLRRLDTRESVVARVTRGELLAGGPGRTGQGWSGRGERYFGAYHLGIFDDSLPREFESRFGSGGWGFGHVEGIGAGQAFGWAGRPIDPVRFEISVAARREEAAAVVASPPAESAEPSKDGRAIPATCPARGLVIFRGNDPALWNRDLYRGANHRARALESVPSDARWLRLRRLDTGASVLVEIDHAGLGKEGGAAGFGFNGSNEVFYGARHLGVYSEAVPQDVETRFTYGGWGFGHRAAVAGEGQAWCWAGIEIPAQTVFEITLYPSRPRPGKNDTALDR